MLNRRVKPFRLQSFMALTLAASFAFAPALFAPVEAFGKKKPKQEDRSDLGGRPVQRNFLPPVAIINGPVEDEAASSAATTPESDTAVETLELSPVETEKRALTLTARPDKLDTKLEVGNAAQLQFLTKQQQVLDKDDYNKLWAATVERNPVIQFALEKVTTPADLAPSVSSQFYKRLGSMAVQGLTVGAMSVLPAGNYARMGTAAAGQAVDNLITGRTKEPVVTLSDTEKIQLAQLLEELNASLLSDYHSYKNTLLLLSDMQQSVINRNNDYSKAIKSGNEVAVMATATAYFKAVKNQTELRQKAKLHRMKLERLAGVESVNGLQLALFSAQTGGQDANGNAVAPEPVEGSDANLVKLEPAPADKKEEVIAAPAVLTESKKLTTPQQQQIEKLQGIMGPREETPAPATQLNEIGPSLEDLRGEDLDEGLNNTDGVTADDFRKAADVQSTLESGHRIGIGEGEEDSPLPSGTEEAMPVLRRAP